MKTLKTTLISSLTVLLALARFSPAQAATHTIVMTDFQFTPATLTIAVGDTVVWTNASSSFEHNSSSGDTMCNPSDLWNAGQIAKGHTFSFTFTGFPPGTNTYICTNHCAKFGMMATLILTNAAGSPTLTAPRFSNGQFQLTVQGIAGQTYIIEGSPDMTNWSGISTNLAPANDFDVTDPAATNPYQFYRARQDLE